MNGFSSGSAGKSKVGKVTVNNKLLLIENHVDSNIVVESFITQCFLSIENSGKLLN